MTRRSTCGAILLVALATAGRPDLTISAQAGSRSVTAAAAAVFPVGATLNGVRLSSLRLGQGVLLAGDGTARGRVDLTLFGVPLIGPPQTITVGGEAASGAVAASGTATISGWCTLEAGSGTPPLMNVPFTLTVTATSVTLTVGTTTLPAAKVNVGSVTIK